MRSHRVPTGSPCSARAPVYSPTPTPVPAVVLKMPLLRWEGRMTSLKAVDTFPGQTREGRGQADVLPRPACSKPRGCFLCVGGGGTALGPWEGRETDRQTDK